MFKKLALSLYSVVVMGMLSACNPGAVLNLKKNESPLTQSTANSSKETENTQIGKPVALPPQYADAPLKPGQTHTQYMPNGLPALSPMKGVNVETLFSENLKNTGERFDRVENAVVDLRKEFETYKPSIVRLAAVESDIQNLIKELEVLLQETPTPQEPKTFNAPEKPMEQAELTVSQLNTMPTSPPVTLSNQKTQSLEKPKPQKPPPEKPKPEQKQTHKGKVAQNLRIGKHADKLRIVIDTNQKFDFNIDIDNNEKLIIVEIPDAKWVGTDNRILSGSKLIQSYTVEPISKDSGTMIIIALKKETSIIKQSTLVPDRSSPYHRIYFDLKL